MPAPRFQLTHEMRYAYDRPVRLSPQRLHLRPAAPVDHIVDYHLQVSPAPQSRYALEDAYGNPETRLLFTEPVTELTIRVELTAVLHPRNPFAFTVEPYAATLPLHYPAELATLLYPYRLLTDPPSSTFLAGTQVNTSSSTTDTLVALNQEVAERVRYEVRDEAGVQPCAVTLDRCRGSCRDSAWLMVQLLRQRGLAARFVSGYLIQQEAEGAAELHAWAEAYVPGAGWIGLDTTSGLLTAEGHLRLAAAPDPAGTMPLIGSSEAAGTELTHHIAITRPAG